MGKLEVWMCCLWMISYGWGKIDIRLLFEDVYLIFPSGCQIKLFSLFGVWVMWLIGGSEEDPYFF